MSQYADDRNLAARQRLWAEQRSPFDLIEWVLGLAPFDRGARALDAGCGNGRYLAELQRRGIDATGCDLSPGMLRSVGAPRRLVQADLSAIPFVAGSFDVAIAAHVLFHVEDRARAAGELRRVLRVGGTLLAVTNGARHLRSVHRLIDGAVHRDLPGWRMRDLASRRFSLENGAEPLATAFSSVTLVRPDPAVNRPFVIRDPAIVSDYVASLADPFQSEAGVAWPVVVERVRAAVEAIIARDGGFLVEGDPGAFVCR
ncbi:MAG: methyltransferase domain-containing protein [Candidatus Dormibacteraeota bacterium]|nr:methyltransferase domain-containing protein [Candidatus Dormibacteraeota bacterium]MBO0745255.1 methyltransferase domain-containing protein [Candidatus Dormibacteraeota bacterium]